MKIILSEKTVKEIDENFFGKLFKFIKKNFSLEDRRTVDDVLRCYSHNEEFCISGVFRKDGCDFDSDFDIESEFLKWLKENYESLKIRK